MNEFMKECIDCLGYNAKDKVTGYEGICSSLAFDLYGCVQVALTPKIKETDKETPFPKTYAFDIHRLEIDRSKRIMEIPNFAAMSYQTETKGLSTQTSDYKHGAAEKPANMFR